MNASALWVMSRLKLSLPKFEDRAGLYFLSDNEMVFTNAKKALLAVDSPRTRGYARYLESETVEARGVRKGKFRIGHKYQ
jgi:hypothetical protein